MIMMMMVMIISGNREQVLLICALMLKKTNGDTNQQKSIIKMKNKQTHIDVKIAIKCVKKKKTEHKLTHNC